MKKKIFLVTFILVFVAAVAIPIGIFFGTKNNALPYKTDADKKPFGVWWWDNRIDNSYLEFACENGVNEIYYYTSSFSDKTSDFISRAADKNIKVYWLTGKYEWIENSSLLHDKIKEYSDFQSQTRTGFAGIHFDIEPHQHPEFKNRRAELLKDFVDLTKEIKDSYPEIPIAYDIPIWMNDKIELDGKLQPVYAHVIDNADFVTLMSYRDTAEKIYDSAKDEIEYALSVGKTLTLGVETSSNDDDIVTFFEEGSEYMYAQLATVKTMIPSDFGIAIHHIKSWRTLKP